MLFAFDSSNLPVPEPNMPISKPVAGARLPGSGGGAIGSPSLYGFNFGDGTSVARLLDA